MMIAEEFISEGDESIKLMLDIEYKYVLQNLEWM
jgi:hypothetical protein